MSRPTSYLPEPNKPPSWGCLLFGVMCAAVGTAMINAIIYAFNRWPHEAWGAVVFGLVLLVVVATVAKVSK